MYTHRIRICMYIMSLQLQLQLEVRVSTLRFEVQLAGPTSTSKSVATSSSLSSPLPVVAAPAAPLAAPLTAVAARGRGAGARAFDVEFLIRPLPEACALLPAVPLSALVPAATTDTHQSSCEIFILLSSLKGICGQFNHESKRLFSPVFGGRELAAPFVNNWSNGMVPLCFAMACLWNRGVDASELHGLDLTDYFTQLGRLSSQFILLESTGGIQRQTATSSTVVDVDDSAASAAAGCTPADTAYVSSSSLAAKRESSLAERGSVTKCSRTTGTDTQAFESAMDSAAYADADRDDDTPTTLINVNAAEHVNKLFSIFVGGPEAISALQSSLGLTQQTDATTPHLVAEATCAKLTHKLQLAIGSQLPRHPDEQRAARAMTAAEIEKIVEMAPGALAARGASDGVLFGWIMAMLCAMPRHFWSDGTHPMAQFSVRFHEYLERSLGAQVETATSFFNGLENLCDSGTKRKAYRNTMIRVANMALSLVVNWCVRVAHAMGACDLDIAIGIFLGSNVRTLEVFAANVYDLDSDEALTEILEVGIMQLGLVNYAALSFLPRDVRQQAYSVWLRTHERQSIELPGNLVAREAVLPLPRAFLDLIVPNHPQCTGEFRASRLWSGTTR